MTLFNPAHPGEILKDIVFETLGLTVSDAVSHLDINSHLLSEVLNAHTAITPEIAIRL